MRALFFILGVLALLLVAAMQFDLIAIGDARPATATSLDAEAMRVEAAEPADGEVR